MNNETLDGGLKSISFEKVNDKTRVTFNMTFGKYIYLCDMAQRVENEADGVVSVSVDMTNPEMESIEIFD